MKKRKKTKIVATLGPAIGTKEKIKELMMAGVNVFRVNFSHADYDDVKTKIKYIRDLNKENNFNVAVVHAHHAQVLLGGKQLHNPIFKVSFKF